MINRTYFRWSAACVFAGAFILSVGYILRTNIEKEFIDEFASTQGFISSVMVAAGSLLFLSGLPALFLAQKLEIDFRTRTRLRQHPAKSSRIRSKRKGVDAWKRPPLQLRLFYQSEGSSASVFNAP